MLLIITTTHQPATDLGCLLHKNPAKCQEFEVSFGKVPVFYPEASAERCTAAMLLDVDPVGMVRGRGGVARRLPRFGARHGRPCGRADRFRRRRLLRMRASKPGGQACAHHGED
jgi:hypothetical protein